MDSKASGIYDYLDESTRFCREKCARLKSLASRSYNFVMKVHHINQDNSFCSVFCTYSEE